jgi:hypothetical protein
MTDIRRDKARSHRLHLRMPSPSGPALLWLAVGTGVFLAALDVIPGAQFWTGQPMTAQAVGGGILFIQGGLLLTGFLRWRELDRLGKITVVAYGSLAQSANDAGRRLLAPLNGADLFQLGIPADDAGPGETRSVAELDRERLARFGLPVTFDELGGSWRSHHKLIKERLPILLTDPAFVRRLYRSAARARRETMAAAALWASTMLVDAEHAEHLIEFQVINTKVEALASRLRMSGLMSREPESWTATDDWIESVLTSFVNTINVYEQIRNKFGSLAKLESDAFTGRLDIAAERLATITAE